MLPATITKKPKCDERLQSKKNEEKHAEQQSTDEVEGESLTQFKKKINLPDSLVPKRIGMGQFIYSTSWKDQNGRDNIVNFRWQGMIEITLAQIKSCH